jgi:hypothetical protein
MARRNDNIKVRTVAGEIGWVDSRSLLEAALWERSVKLLETIRGLPVQARGRTKVQTNLRVEPGRASSRLYQFGRGVPVEIISRAVADWVQVTDEREGSNEPLEAKKEDWFLVRAVATRPPEESVRGAETVTTTQPGDQSIPIAGWVVARFIELFIDAPRVGEAYNLGGGRQNSCSIWEAFAKVAQITSREMCSEYVDQNRAGDHVCYISDLTKIKQHYPPWDITKSLDDILDETVRAWCTRMKEND